MADFRKWIYAFAVVAILVGLTIPASAQVNTAVQCVQTGSNIPTVRSEGYTELVGDLVLTCTGGIPTPSGQAVPQVNVQIFLNTTVTSKLTTSGGFSEALLIIDEPNSPINPTRPILNCGGSNTSGSAPDNGPALAGVCSITSIGDPSYTYDGCSITGETGVDGLPAATACSTSGTYGSGRPNVFQGRQALAAANGGQTNSVVFEGVPFDPPGTTTTRTIRITNIRANANAVGVSSTLVQTFIYENISISGNASVSLNNSLFYVAFVQRGLTGGVQQSNLGFTQCTSVNTKLAGGTAGPYTTYNNTAQPDVRFSEGFASAWKVKNIAEILTYGSTTIANSGGTYIFNPGAVGATYPTDQNQNVPGVSYNTESGFEDSSTFATPAPNPPAGFSTATNLSATATNVTGGGSLNNNALSNATGISSAGSATQGTRLAVTFANIPQGASLYAPAIVYFYAQGSTLTNGTSSTQPGATPTGFMVLVSGTDAAGQGGSPVTVTGPTGTNTNVASLNNLVAISATNPVLVYEVLFDNPFALEQADVPVVLAYATNLATNLPQPGVVTTASVSFAPYYTSASAGTAQVVSSSAPIPRFFPDGTPANAIEIVKCACDLLFPYVVNVAGYDTGIAIANTSLDPGATYGFISTGAQFGSVEFWYYGTMANGGATPQPQCTNSTTPGSCTGTLTTIPAGTVMTYVLSTGSTSFGLDNRGAGFTGYVIAQTGFQYCHAFAFISAAQGPGAVNAGTSEGYLALILDPGSLARTVQSAESLNN